MAYFGLLSYLGVGVGDFKRGSVGDVEVISKCGNRGGRRGGGFVVNLDVLSLSQIMTYANFYVLNVTDPQSLRPSLTFNIFEPGSIHLARELLALLVVVVCCGSPELSSQILWVLKLLGVDCTWY